MWQLFDAMVEAVGNGGEDQFLLAGGVLIHYVGDACQPLHTSYLSQGDPNRVVPRPRATDKKILEADGVHSGYEDDMVNYGWMEKELGNELTAEIKRQQSESKAGQKEAIRDIQTGRDAAKAILDLIAATHKSIAPRDIVEEWVALRGTPKKERNEEMWQKFGAATVECMARGSRYLAAIWTAAWARGDGDKTIGKGKARKQSDLMKLYNNPKIVPSVRLDAYEDLLKKSDAAVAATA